MKAVWTKMHQIGRFAILHTNLFSTDLRLEKKVMIDLRIDYLMSG